MGLVNMHATLLDAVAAHDNDHSEVTSRFEREYRLGWHEPTPPGFGRGVRLSVLIPANNNAHSLATTLDALTTQDTAADVEVIVVDDASTDDTPEIIANHPAVDTALRLSEQSGAGAARNVAACLATGDTLVFLDADMVLPAHVLADIAARTRDDAVLVGFRHNVRYQPAEFQRSVVPEGEPDLQEDHRVRWNPPAGVPMFYSGQVYDTPFTAHPLDDTRDFIDLGHGRMYYDWDLPRMVVTALVTSPRAAFHAVGGFDPAFGPSGWGNEDTHLGAALIGYGCKVIPLRQAKGWHINPPDAEAAWKIKLAGAPARIAAMRRLLQNPPPAYADGDLAARVQTLITQAVTLV
jgi:glycosyltransferase involved in cell wall biosynthesis